MIAFGHTADDFCESFLRNAMFTGRGRALPAITYSRDKEFRLIRPLVFVTEEITPNLRRRLARQSFRAAARSEPARCANPSAACSAKSKRTIRI